MTLRTWLASALTLLMAGVPVPVAAQAPSTDWHAAAFALPPQAFVTVRLTDGSKVQGYLMELTDDGIVVQPRTRRRVAPRTIDGGDISSLTLAKEPRSPGKTVAMVVGGVWLASGLVMVTLLMAVLAGAGD